MQRKYGRKIPAPMPAHRMLSRSDAVKDVVDLRSWCGPIKDQGQLGSCTGHAFSSGMEWIWRRYYKKEPILSPLYIYSRELLADGNFPNDDGSTGETGCNVAIVYGCCEDSLYPDSTRNIQQPTSIMDTNAQQYRLGAYHGLNGSSSAISVIADPTPWPVEIGFTVYDSFESEEVAKTGIYNPKSGETVLGGHEVLMIGVDTGVAPTLRPANCPPAALIQNSWGTDWGIGGCFWMALSVLDDPQTDLKIAHAGHPW